MELMGTLVVRDKSDRIQSMMMRIGLEEEFRKHVETNANAQIENVISHHLYLQIIRELAILIATKFQKISSDAKCT